MSLLSTIVSMVLFLSPPAQDGKLQSTDLKEGTGVAAKANDWVTVEYVGTLADGKQFDASKGKAPFVFTLGVGQVVKGWDLGLVGMKVGGKRKLVIPPDMAYGGQAVGEIPANSTLTFEVEMLKIDHPGDKETLKVEHVADGKGDSAKDGDQVDVSYTGSFINGVEFDSTKKRNDEPLHVVLGRTKLISGFTDGLKDIKVGEKRKLTIPPALAYGDGARGQIPGHSTLIFEIEALKIIPKSQLAEQKQKELKLLKLEDSVKGTGPEAKDGDIVEVHYTGMFTDGKKFDSSKDRGQTMKITLGSGQVIKGFDYGILGMKVGGTRKITIPSEMGYGAAGAGGVIPPNATLIFEIELVSIAKK